LQLTDVFRSLKRHWLMSVVIVLLTASALGVYLFTRNETLPPEVWRASVQVLIPARDADGEDPPGVPPRLLRAQEALGQSTPTIDAALVGAGIGPSDRGNHSFSISLNERRDIVTLSATGGDRPTALRLASSYATAYLDTRRRVAADSADSTRTGARQSIEILRERLAAVNYLLLLGPGPSGSPGEGELAIELLTAERQALLSRLSEARQAYAEASTDNLVPNAHGTVVTRSDPLRISGEPSSPVTPAAVIVGIGLLLAVAAPALRDRFDNTIREPREAVRDIGAPLLSVLPSSARRQTQQLAEPGSELERAYRSLAATTVATDELPRALVVTSPVGSLQDHVAANFAAALADMGLKVALIATDERQSWFIGDEHRPVTTTLPDLLALAHAGHLNGQVADSLIPTERENLVVLAPGVAELDELLEGMPALLETLTNIGIDVTVIAGPALLEDPTATLMVWSTRRVLWVLESGSSTSDEAREASSRLVLAGAGAFGVTLVDARR
jgi:hypothetical protein